MYRIVHLPWIESLDIYSEERKRIDSDIIGRCERYGLSFLNDTKPRRIYFGALIADENWELFRIHATEAFNIYHVVVLVESNTTFMGTPRNLRFNLSNEALLLQNSSLFGTQSKVHVEFWNVNRADLVGMPREIEQRNHIITRWKQEGMTSDDLGIISDIDEMFSRDFLRAVQTCDFPELRPKQDCHKPKIVPSSIFFEASPFCIKIAPWYHPDVISGQCIHGIGALSNSRHSFGGNDIRVKSSYHHKYNFVNTSFFGHNAVFGTAYHLHNWFPDYRILRHKYMTFSHSNDAVMQLTLSQIASDVDIQVRCCKGLGNNISNPYSDMPDSWNLFFENGKEMGGNRPIFFLNRTYNEMRHDMVTQLIQIDEEEFGSSYNQNGLWNDSKVFPSPREKIQLSMSLQ